MKLFGHRERTQPKTSQVLEIVCFPPLLDPLRGMATHVGNKHHRYRMLGSVALGLAPCQLSGGPGSRRQPVLSVAVAVERSHAAREITSTAAATSLLLRFPLRSFRGGLPGLSPCEAFHPPRNPLTVSSHEANLQHDSGRVPYPSTVACLDRKRRPFECPKHSAWPHPSSALAHRFVGCLGTQDPPALSN
jgi:hypothetical protein